MGMKSTEIGKVDFSNAKIIEVIDQDDVDSAAKFIVALDDGSGRTVELWADVYNRISWSELEENRGR